MQGFPIRRIAIGTILGGVVCFGIWLKFWMVFGPMSNSGPNEWLCASIAPSIFGMATGFIVGAIWEAFAPASKSN